MSRANGCELHNGDEESECWSQCQAGRDGDCFHPECPQGVPEKDRLPRCPHDLLCRKHDEPKIMPVIHKAAPLTPTLDQWRALALAAFEYARHVPAVQELAIAMGLRTREREETERDGKAES